MAKKDDSLDVLKEPVHLVVLKPHHVQELTRKGKLPGGGVVYQAPPPQTVLPGTKKLKKKYNPLEHFDMKSVMKPARDAIRKTRLTVLHNYVKPIPSELKPPCGECETSSCCRAFVVGITQREFESGYYDPYAVKLDPKYMKQLRGRLLLPSTATSPILGVKDKSEYYLEGRIGEDCSFLKNNQCSIYEHRPITCRVYTCVGDERVTQDMRDGITTVFSRTKDQDD
jgi:Fe-S-cluster containining protein